MLGKLISAVAEKGYQEKDVEKIVKEFFILLGKELKKGSKVEIENFGTFHRRKRASMIGEEFIRAFWSPGFTPDESLKEEIKDFDFEEYTASKKAGEKEE